MDTNAIESRSMTALARLTLCAALILAAAQAAAAPAPKARYPQPSPAMWKLESDGSTMYLFGSMHMLPAGLKWKTPIVQRAMESADIFLFEIPMSDGEMRLAYGTMMKNIYLPEDKTLSGMLSPGGKKQLAAIAKDLGIEMKALDRMRPWSAAVLISKAMGGTTPVVSGADTQIGYYALTSLKTRRYFERGSEQVEMLARMGDADGAKGFEAGLKEMRRNPQEFTRLAIAWVTGDAAKLVNITDAGTVNSPLGRKILFDERNQAWVAKIPELLHEKRTFFVTVGAGHLVGHGSVIELLCGKGLKLQRVDTKTGNAKAACPARNQVVAARTPR
jgi:uncharacterized protein